MLTRFFSRLRRVAPVARPTQAVRPRALNLEALEAREVPAIIYALQGGVVPNMPAVNANTLLRFDSATPGTIIATTAVTGLGTGETLQGIDFRPRTGQLYGITFPTTGAAPQPAKTYTINPLTGVATLVGTSAAITNGTNAVSSDIDFNPTVDRIRYVGGDGTLNGNARINPNNGLGTGLTPPSPNDTPITPALTVLIGAAYDRNTDRQSAANIPTTLYAIDRATNTLGRVGAINGGTAPGASPNDGVFTPIGPLGITLAAGDEGGFDIVEATGPASAANNNGNGIAYAVLTTAANVTGLYTINLTTGAATLVGTLGAGNAEVFDIAVVPEGTVVVGSGAGANGDVRILEPNGTLRAAVSNPFQGFLGGVRVATGDVNGDGVPDAIVTAVQAANGHVKVFDGTTGLQLNSAIGSFFAFQGYTGSVNIAAGDVNGDGFADVIVVANGINGFQANGHVKAFSGRDGSQITSFFSYSNYNGNVTVSTADFDNDGVDEIVTAAAINGHTKVFNGTTTALFTSTSLPSFQSSFFAFSPYLGDVSVAAGDVNGDGIADLVLGSGQGVRFNVRVVNGRDGSQINSFFVDFNNNTAFTGGGRVSVSDFNRDGLYDLVATPGLGTAATAVAFNPLTAQSLGTFTAFANFQGGATVAGTRF